MSKLRMRIAMSLDGFVAGPDQSAENPLGIGGLRLHEWVFPLAEWRKNHGESGGVDNASNRVIAESTENLGATIMGRNMFGPIRGEWDASEPWNGWWGSNPPYHHPVFVLTHYPREPLTLEGGTTFHFVTDGIESAFQQAHRAADGKDVSLAGGASACRQHLNAGLVDEMEISLVPIVLGAGERLFDGVDNLRDLRLLRTVPDENVTHLKFARRPR